MVNALTIEVTSTAALLAALSALGVNRQLGDFFDASASLL
jgi:hypothetical protein